VSTRPCACRRITRLPALSELDGLVVVLVRARNPLNIGAAARAMSNFGAHRLRLVNPFAGGFREARSAVGASDLLEKVEEYKTVAEAVADCALVVGTTAIRKRVLLQPVRRLDEPSGKVIREQMQRGKVAVLFGSEKIGLTSKDLSHCHWLLNIPTSQRNISMNLGQSVAVCLYELARGTQPEPEARKIEPASAEQTELIMQCLFGSLRISGYVKPGTDEMFEKKTRNLILRFNLEAYDAKLLLGMLRQIAWKLGPGRKS